MSLDNNYIWFLMLFVNYSFITLAFRFFKKEGLFAWVVLSSVLANIQVLKTVELFGFVTTLG
ncbi:MAG: VUT family protein, partial [Candidatus Riflebacteria bacterium]